MQRFGEETRTNNGRSGFLTQPRDPGAVNAAPVRGQLVAVVVTGAHDVLVHRLRRPAARTAVRFTTAVALVGLARADGVPWAQLGLGRGEFGSGVRTGAAAAAAAAAAVFAGAALPATRRFFLDERSAAAAARDDLAAELARITFAAVPPEELIYRSALLGLWLGRGPRASAVAWSSVLFGLSHILPTLSTMNQTALHDQLARRPLRQAAFVAGNVAVTAAAGAAFGWLRLRSGSVVAPLLAHAALNDAALAAGRVAHGLGHERAGRKKAFWPFPRRASGGIIDARPSAAVAFTREALAAGPARIRGWPPSGG
jgi:membrane protease YdiL (CAAX protease family)